MEGTSKSSHNHDSLFMGRGRSSTETGNYRSSRQEGMMPMIYTSRMTYLRALTSAVRATKMASAPPAFITAWPRSLTMWMIALAMVLTLLLRLTLRSVSPWVNRSVP